MKVKRGKHARKVLTFYKGNFGFEPPFKVVIDGTFCKAALSFRVNIADQIPRYFESEVRLCTTTCAMAECEAFGSILYGPLKVLRQYEVVTCGHDTPIPAAHCLRSLVRKHNCLKYMLATQDQELTEMSRKKSGIPLLYIAHNTITLEAPSQASKVKASREVKESLAPTDYEHQVLVKLKLAEFGEEEKRRKKRKVKGANPLSCKPKKKKEKLVTPLKEKTKRRKRKRVKIAEHVKEHLKPTAVS